METLEAENSSTWRSLTHWDTAVTWGIARIYFHKSSELYVISIGFNLSPQLVLSTDLAYYLTGTSLALTNLTALLLIWQKFSLSPEMVIPTPNIYSGNFKTHVNYPLKAYNTYDFKCFVLRIHHSQQFLNILNVKGAVHGKGGESKGNFLLFYIIVFRLAKNTTIISWKTICSFLRKTL